MLISFKECSMVSQTQSKPQRLVIHGLTNRGQTFCPRDWAERLCGCMATLGPSRQQQFDSHVYVSFSFVPGIKSLVVEQELRESNPKGYDFLVSFAQDNNLRVSEESEQNNFSMAVGQ
jgi:hypothetical protein